MTKEQVADLARHIPTDESANGVIGVTAEEWFVVGPKCLELWYQFKGPRFPIFTDPYIKKIVSSLRIKK